MAAGVARRRRRRGGQAAADRRSVAGGLGRGPAGRRASCPPPGSPASSSPPRWPCGIPMSPNDSCRATGVCWSATAACRGWRPRCCGCATGDGSLVAAAVLDRARRPDADRADARGDRRAGLLRRAGGGPVPAALRGGVPRCGGAGRAAVAGRAAAGGIAVVDPGGRGARSSPPGPNRASARCSASPASAESGTARRYPASRTTLFAVVATVVLLAVVAIGLPTAVRRPGARPLLVLAAVAVAAPALMATGPGLAAVEASPARCPVSACCATARSGSRWRCPATPWPGSATVSRCGAGCQLGVTAAVCCLALVAVLPDLAWGVGGKVTSVRYPAGWTAAAALINADPRPVAVLPPDSMRHFPWAGDAPVLDPLPRWVSADVLTTGDLMIGGQTVPGEGAARAGGGAPGAGPGPGVDELAAAGVGWVVVEGATDRGSRLPMALADPDVTVYRSAATDPAAPHRGLLIAAHLVWLATLLAGAAGHDRHGSDTPPPAVLSTRRHGLARRVVAGRGRQRLQGSAAAELHRVRGDVPDHPHHHPADPGGPRPLPRRQQRRRAHAPLHAGRRAAHHRRLHRRGVAAAVGRGPTSPGCSSAWARHWCSTSSR